MSDKKNKNYEKFSPPLEIPATTYTRTPETPLEIINAYGTYEIQATADTDADFPCIAQGLGKNIQRDPRFFRGPDDFNPASDRSDKHVL